MTKAELEARISAIGVEMQQLKANYSKLEGHLAEANHWMQEMIKAENPQNEEQQKEQCCGEANHEEQEQAAEE